MAILDYSRTLNAAGQQTPLQGMIETRKGLQGLKANDMVMKQHQQQQEAQQAEAQRIQAARVQGAELLKSGTPEQIADFGIMNPNVMKDLIAASGFADKQAVNSRLNYAKNVLSGSVSPRDAINARIQEIEFRGGNADQLRLTAQGTDEDIIEAARKDFSVIDPQDFKSYTSATGQGESSQQPFKVQSSEILNDGTVISVGSYGKTQVTDSSGEVLTGDKAKEHLREVRKAETQSKRDFKRLEVETAKAKARAKGVVAREKEDIMLGVEAAQTVPILNRADKLLDLVETGKPQQAVLWAKKNLGIETGNEGELENLLGKQILKQLKPTFGSQFTANEGAWLKSMESDWGRSTQSNRRLVRQGLLLAEKRAMHGITAAQAGKDARTEQLIKDYLDFKIKDMKAEDDALTTDQIRDASDEELLNF